MKQTIIVTARQSDWEQAKAEGEYRQSTIDSTLADVGFIHGSFADQVIDMVNRKYADQDNLMFLLVDPDKVKSEIKYETARSGRAGTFPHIYGALNVDAVYAEIQLQKNAVGNFMTPPELATHNNR